MQTECDRDDVELIRNASAGSAGAWNELYLRYLRLIRHIVADNVTQVDDADDVVQEVFARAFTRLDSLQDPARFRSWISQIARRAAIDARRARTRRPVMVGLDDVDPIEEHSAPDLEAEVRVLAAAIRAGVAGLSERDMSVLTMVVELGFGLDQVAAALDLRPDTAKVALHRARKRLRTTVELELLTA